MALNIRQKGAGGEREIIALLEPIVRAKMLEFGLQVPDKPILQRNQNQSAVGGCDLTNTFGLAIEVKRQEQLAVNEWWRQCCASAARNHERPVLMYRQNQKKWNVVMMAHLTLPVLPEARNGLPMSLEHRVTLSMDDFLVWFRQYVTNVLHTDYRPQL